MADDVRTAPRLFVISTQPKAGIYAAAYQSAVHDLKSGHDVALVVETRPIFAGSWARTSGGNAERRSAASQERCSRVPQARRRDDRARNRIASSGAKPASRIVQASRTDEAARSLQRARTQARARESGGGRPDLVAPYGG